jgi:DNA-directed RNA polymerase specialized sigma24 family protein
VEVLPAPVGEAEVEASGDQARETFAAFVAEHEPALRRSLIAAFGPEVGREAAAEALAQAWPRWERVSGLRNPPGYVFQVGRNVARRRLRRERMGRSLERAHAPDPVGAVVGGEPGLTTALSHLSERQRAAVLLVHGYGYTLIEAATAMGCSPSTVRNHLERGMARLRADLGVELEGDGDA